MNSSTIQPPRLLRKESRPAICLFVALLLGGATLNIHAAASNSVARVWDERALAAIRADTPHPPAQARNYFSLSVCMWDSWAAYDTNGAVGYVYRGKHTSTNVVADRNKAISYAAWRMLKERHAYSITPPSGNITSSTRLAAH